MKKEEFILQAIISMAGNVVGTDGTTDIKDWQNVVVEAIDLAREVEEHGLAFDD